MAFCYVGSSTKARRKSVLEQNGYRMKKAGYLIIFTLLFAALHAVCAQEELSVLTVASEEVEEPETAKPAVTAVYGVTADDYLPQNKYEEARRHLRPNLRRASSRPAFDLPDGFFFIGGPIFLLILLRVLVIFINGFEEKRKEEENQVASEHFNPE